MNLEKRFGKRLFKNARFKVPDDSIDPGENTGISGGGAGSKTLDNADDHADEKKGNKLTNEELIERITQTEIRIKQAEAEAERQKLENDKLVAEKEKLKTQLTAKMTAEEQIDEAKKEAEAAKNKRLEEVESELAVIKATKRYMTLKMDEKGAEEVAKLEISGDMETVTKILGKHILEIEKTAAENAINKFLADRPDIKAGNGTPEKQSLAIEKAKEFASGGIRNVNAEALKKFM